MARGGSIGNDNGVALKDPKMRQKAYKQFCEHLAKGKSYQSWYFEEGDNLCCYDTMLSYIEKFPLEFPSIKKKVAQTKGLQYWEKVCEESAEGKNTKANTASLQMVMRNKFGWDKEKYQQTQKGINITADGKLVTGLNIRTEELPGTDNQGSESGD